MKKGIILLALIFTACVNLDNIGGNSGGEVKEIKNTNISTSKIYERKNGSLYVDNVLANGKQEYKEILSTLNITIGYIDKIASGFYGIEETALALLLGFRENKTLDQLAHIRYILQIAMEKQFSNEEYDEIIEQEVKTWKPPYNSSKEELLLMLEK